MCVPPSGPPTRNLCAVTHRNRLRPAHRCCISGRCASARVRGRLTLCLCTARWVDDAGSVRRGGRDRDGFPSGRGGPCSETTPRHSARRAQPASRGLGGDPRTVSANLADRSLMPSALSLSTRSTGGADGAMVDVWVRWKEEEATTRCRDIPDAACWCDTRAAATGRANDDGGGG
jgi:hypothetical protein